MNTFVLVIKALAVILPWLINAVRDGKIKDASETAMLEAIVAQVIDRAVAAQQAKKGALKDDEDNDPNNRTRVGGVELHRPSVG